VKITKTQKGSVAIDFDGVINSYKSGFISVDQIPDPPVPGVFNKICEYLDYGFIVYIYSTRNTNDIGRLAIYKWFIKHGMLTTYVEKLNIVSAKPVAKLYIDDRGYQFTGQLPSIKYIENFTPWHGGVSSSQKISS